MAIERCGTNPESTTCACAARSEGVNESGVTERAVRGAPSQRAKHSRRSGYGAHWQRGVASSGGASGHVGFVHTFSAHRGAHGRAGRPCAGRLQLGEHAWQMGLCGSKVGIAPAAAAFAGGADEEPAMVGCTGIGTRRSCPPPRRIVPAELVGRLAAARRVAVPTLNLVAQDAMHSGCSRGSPCLRESRCTARATWSRATRTICSMRRWSASSTRQPGNVRARCSATRSLRPDGHSATAPARAARRCLGSTCRPGWTAACSR